MLPWCAQRRRGRRVHAVRTAALPAPTRRAAAARDASRKTHGGTAHAVILAFLTREPTVVRDPKSLERRARRRERARRRRAARRGRDRGRSTRRSHGRARPNCGCSSRARRRGCASARSRELGACGAARCASTPAERSRTRARMRASFARGDLATWGYDDGYARSASDPRTLLHGAQRVVCVAVPYATPRRRARARCAGASRTTRGRADYHRTLARVARSELAGDLTISPAPCDGRDACDTAPLAERAFAARAGPRMDRQAHQLIAPSVGSYVFLGEIVTSLAASASTRRYVRPAALHALRDGVPDRRAARRLHDRRHPLHLRSHAAHRPDSARDARADRRPGCGAAISARSSVRRPCARRRARGGVRAARSKTRAPGSGRAARACVAANSSAAIARTAMGWRGAAVLRRNAAIALGNALDRAAVPALVQSLEADPHPMVRGAAAWALGRIGSPRARRALQSARRLGDATRACARKSLSRLRGYGTPTRPYR